MKDVKEFLAEAERRMKECMPKLAEKMQSKEINTKTLTNK